MPNPRNKAFRSTGDIRRPRTSPHTLTLSLTQTQSTPRPHVRETAVFLTRRAGGHGRPGGVYRIQEGGRGRDSEERADCKIKLKDRGGGASVPGVRMDVGTDGVRDT